MARIIDGKTANLSGERIRAARLSMNMSQQELSDKLETYAVYVCRGSVSRIESGDRMVTDIELDAFSRVLNVTLSYLLNREEI